MGSRKYRSRKSFITKMGPLRMIFPEFDWSRISGYLKESLPRPFGARNDNWSAWEIAAPLPPSLSPESSSGCKHSSGQVGARNDSAYRVSLRTK